MTPEATRHSTETSSLAALGLSVTAVEPGVGSTNQHPSG